MIQSIIAGTYGDARTGLKTSKIETKIVSYESTPEKRIYTLENYLVNEEGAKTLYGNAFPVPVPNEKLSQLDAAIESMGISFTKVVEGVTVELRGNEREWKKLPYGLLLFVQNDFVLDENGNPTDKTVFLLNPEDWELCPE